MNFICPVFFFLSEFFNLVSFLFCSSMVEKRALWWLPSFPWPYRRFDLSDKRNGKDSNAMYCSPFAILLCIVYCWWVINDFWANYATWWLFYVWFLSNDSYHVQTYDLWFLSVLVCTICRTILWSNIQLTMFILGQYYTYALSNVTITFIYSLLFCE